MLHHLMKCPASQHVRISLGTRSKDTLLYCSPSQAWNAHRAQPLLFRIHWHHSLSSFSVSLFRHRGLQSKSCCVCNVLQGLVKIRLLWWMLNSILFCTRTILLLFGHSRIQASQPFIITKIRIRIILPQYSSCVNNFRSMARFSALAVETILNGDRESYRLPLPLAK